MKRLSSKRADTRFFDVAVFATAAAVAVNTLLMVAGFLFFDIRRSPVVLAVLLVTLLLYAVCFVLVVLMRRAFTKQLEKADEQQRLAKESKNVYISGLMHDIATPITRINGCASMISDGVVTDLSDIRKFASMIIQNTEDINIMLKNLAEIEKYNSAHISENLLPINLYTLLDEYIRYLSLELAGQNVKICLINLCKSAPVCKIDVKSCKRVFMNLINNSVKYKKPDIPCEIVITLDTDKNGNLLFAFADNGTGVEEGTQEKLFEMFYRADGSRHNVKDGNGVGLFVSAEIIKSFNGKIWAENNGNGLTVFVSLPLTQESAVRWF